MLAACRLATAGPLLALGLTVAEVAALYHTTPARLYRRLRLEPPAPPPYLAGRRLAARVAGEAPLFVARRALLPLLPPFDARCWRWPALLAREA